jgi:hypothetical protein
MESVTSLFTQTLVIESKNLKTFINKEANPRCEFHKLPTVIRIRFLEGAANFSRHHSVQTHVASYPMGAGGSFPGDKAVGTRS